MFYGMDETAYREFQRALAVIRGIYPRNFAGDMLITLGRNMTFMEDARFVAAVESQQPNGQEASLLWRLHVLCWCARNALGVEGDFVECGVFRGFMTAVATQYLDFASQPRHWHLYDTFEGIPDSQLDPGHANPVSYQQAELHDFVVARFAAYPNVKVHRGRVPDVLFGSAPTRIAFLHLDMNSSKAELAALEQLYDRLAPGAHVLLDDYGWSSYRDQMIAERAFFSARSVPVLELPTGQGLVVMPPHAAKAA